MPKTHFAPFARGRTCQQPPVPVARVPGPPPAAANPLRIPRLDLPLRLVVERGYGRLERYGDHPFAPTDWTTEINRFVKAGHLRPEDEAESSEAFLNLATARAFPPAPSFKRFGIKACYAFQPHVIENKMNPGDHGGIDIPEHSAPWITLEMTSRNAWCVIGPLLRHLEAKWPGFGSWICTALWSPLTISPRNYEGWISEAFWMGCKDEAEVVGERHLNAEEPEDEYSGPTRKDFDAHVPGWARHLTSESVSGHQRFLKLAARLFDVDFSPLFGKPGKAANWDVSAPCAHWDAYLRPILFNWNDNDMVLEAIDTCFNDAMQSEGVCDTTCGIKVESIESAAATLSQAWRALAIYDQLVGAFNRYRKEHKLV